MAKQYTPKEIIAAKKEEKRLSADIAILSKDIAEAKKQGSKWTGDDLDSMEMILDTKKEEKKLQADIHTEYKKQLKSQEILYSKAGAHIKLIINKKDLEQSVNRIIKYQHDITSDIYSILTESSSIRNDILKTVGKEKLLNYDIAAVSEQINEIKGRIATLSGQAQKDAKKELELLEDSHLATSKVAEKMQVQNKLMNKLLGVVGLSVEGMKDMVKQAIMFGRALLKNPVLLVLAAIVGSVLAMKKLLDMNKSLRDDAGVSLRQAKGLNTELYNLETVTRQWGAASKEAGSFWEKISTSAIGITSSAVTKVGDILLGVNAKDSMIAILNATGMLRDVQYENIRLATDLQAAYGVMPADTAKLAKTISDIAENSEDIAKYTDGTLTSMTKAAIEARKMGVNLGVTAKIADSLLDFETSIEGEMEASLLIGKQLNYNRARALALEGDIAGAARDIVRQIGGEGTFRQLNVLQRKALAGSIGVTVEELSRLASGKSLKVAVDTSMKDAQDNLAAGMLKLSETMTRLGLQYAAAGVAGALLARAAYKKIKGKLQKKTPVKKTVPKKKTTVKKTVPKKKTTVPKKTPKTPKKTPKTPAQQSLLDRRAQQRLDSKNRRIAKNELNQKMKLDRKAKRKIQKQERTLAREAKLEANKIKRMEKLQAKKIAKEVKLKASGKTGGKVIKPTGTGKGPITGVKPKPKITVAKTLTGGGGITPKNISGLSKTGQWAQKPIITGPGKASGVLRIRDVRNFGALITTMKSLNALSAIRLIGGFAKGTVFLDASPLSAQGLEGPVNREAAIQSLKVGKDVLHMMSKEGGSWSVEDIAKAFAKEMEIDVETRSDQTLGGFRNWVSGPTEYENLLQYIRDSLPEAREYRKAGKTQMSAEEYIPIGTFDSVYGALLQKFGTGEVTKRDGEYFLMDVDQRVGFGNLFPEVPPEDLQGPEDLFVSPASNPEVKYLSNEMLRLQKEYNDMTDAQKVLVAGEEYRQKYRVDNMFGTRKSGIEMGEFMELLERIAIATETAPAKIIGGITE